MLTKEQFKMFRNDVEQALNNVALKYGVDIHAGNIGYTDISFNMKLEMTKKNCDGKSYEQAEFEKHCGTFGFSPADYGRKASNLGKEYTLKGFAIKKRKNPIIVEINGKDYVISEQQAHMLFGITEDIRRANILQALKSC